MSDEPTPNLPPADAPEPAPEVRAESDLPTPPPPAEPAAPELTADEPALPAEPAAAAEPEVTAEADAEEAAEPPEAPTATAVAEPPKPSNKHWYVVKVQSGREESIKGAIERRVKIEGLEEFFGQIVIPTEKVTEMRSGKTGTKRVVKDRKKFPGYLFCEVEFNDRILYLFRETSGVGDFVGGGHNRVPMPMSDREVQSMLGSKGGPEEGGGREKVTLKFDKGDRVRIRESAFAGMEGEIKEITEPKDAKDTYRVRVEVQIFGRPVSVDLEYWQVDPL